MVACTEVGWRQCQDPENLPCQRQSYLLTGEVNLASSGWRGRRLASAQYVGSSW